MSHCDVALFGLRQSRPEQSVALSPRSKRMAVRIRATINAGSSENFEAVGGRA